MVVLIAKSTYIEIWISIDLHVKWFNWSMIFPKKIAKLPKDLKRNVNWSQKEKISILRQFSEVPMYRYGAFVLCFTYSVIRYAYGGKVRISNLSTLTEVRISNLVYVYRVILQNKTVRKLKVHI